MGLLLLGFLLYLYISKPVQSSAHYFFAATWNAYAPVPPIPSLQTNPQIKSKGEIRTTNLCGYEREVT